MRRSMGAAWGMNASRQCSVFSHEPETASAPKEWYMAAPRGGLAPAVPPWTLEKSTTRFSPTQNWPVWPRVS